MNIENFEKLPVMGIIRNLDEEDLEPLIETAVDSGLETLEFALNSNNALSLIRNAVAISSGRLTIGAGTVLNKEDLKAATDAGASFVVSPLLIDEVATYCSEKNIPFFPGALTPTEIHKAWQAGATMVKVFPASVFGPSYLKTVKGPFNDIKLMAVGGVSIKNTHEYFRNGVDAVAFGASLIKREWLNKGDYSSIGQAIKEFVFVTNNSIKN